MPRLTKRFIETITPDTKKTLVFWDEALKGFGVVVLPSGRRTYYIQAATALKFFLHRGRKSEVMHAQREHFDLEADI